MNKKMALILVIDDEEGMRALLRGLLEKEGHKVLEAPDGMAGIRLYQENRPDLVITDIFMPEKEGTQTILELRKNNPNVKIIAISGGELAARIDVLGTAKIFGALRVLAKPFRLEDMRQAVNELLAQ